MNNTTEILPSTFNRRVRMLRAVPVTQNTGGTDTASYTTLFSTFASIDSMKSSRKVYLGIDQFTNAYDIIFRYTPDRLVNIADVLDYLDGGTTKRLLVMSVQLINQGYKRYQVLTAQEVTVSE